MSNREWGGNTSKSYDMSIASVIEGFLRDPRLISGTCKMRTHDFVRTAWDLVVDKDGNILGSMHYGPLCVETNCIKLALNAPAP